MSNYDVIVVGNGPAGLSASIYLCRASKHTLVLGGSSSALTKARSIENYFGFTDPIDGTELLRKGTLQAQRLGADIRLEEALEVKFNTFGFSVLTAEAEYNAKVLILATGTNRKVINIPGFNDFLGKGISFCAVCDGFLYKGKHLGVLGSGNYAQAELQELLRFSDDITLFTNGETPAFDYPHTVTEKVTSVAGSSKIASISTTKDTYPIDGLFVAIGTANALDFAAKIGLITENNSIKTDNNGCTNCPGVFAAGDCTGGLMQIATAVAGGAVAARSAIKYLDKETKND